MEEAKAEIRLLHIYGQKYWHDEAIIVGNTAALEALAHAINEALEKKRATTEAFVADGEGYEIAVLLNDEPPEHEAWIKMALPYTDPIAAAEWKERKHPKE